MLYCTILYYTILYYTSCILRGLKAPHSITMDQVLDEGLAGSGIQRAKVAVDRTTTSTRTRTKLTYTVSGIVLQSLRVLPAHVKKASKLQVRGSTCTYICIYIYIYIRVYTYVEIYVYLHLPIYGCVLCVLCPPNGIHPSPTTTGGEDRSFLYFLDNSLELLYTSFEIPS